MEGTVLLFPSLIRSMAAMEPGGDWRDRVPARAWNLVCCRYTEVAAVLSEARSTVYTSRAVCAPTLFESRRTCHIEYLWPVHEILNVDENKN